MTLVDLNDEIARVFEKHGVMVTRVSWRGFLNDGPKNATCGEIAVRDD